MIPGDAVEVGIVTGELGQTVGLHDGDDQRVAGQQARLPAHVDGRGHLAAGDRQDIDADEEEVVAPAAAVGRGAGSSVADRVTETATTAANTMVVAMSTASLCHTGTGTAWLRLASIIGPFVVGMIRPAGGLGGVFLMFAIAALVGGIVTLLFGMETRGRLLEELSP